MPGPAILQDTPVGGRGVWCASSMTMVWKSARGGPAGSGDSGLHTGHDGRGGMLVARRLYNPQRQRRVDQVQFGDGLLDELIAVRQDERPLRRRCTRRANTIVFPVPVGNTSRAGGSHARWRRGGRPRLHTGRGGAPDGMSLVVAQQLRSCVLPVCKVSSVIRSAVWHHRLNMHVCLT